MTQRGSTRKVANSLVVASSAAVLAVYAAGYVRTQAATDQLQERSPARRPAPPVPGSQSPAPIGPAPVSIPQAPVASAPKPELIASAAPASAAVDIPNVTKELVLAPAPVPTHPAEPVAAAVVEDKTAVAAAPAAPVVPSPPWKDGKYDGWGWCRHGDIQAQVVIEGGRVASAKIAQCLTRYSCDVIDKLPPQVAQRQSPEVDYVSGATESTDAFYWAVVDALRKAK